MAVSLRVRVTRGGRSRVGPFSRQVVNRGWERHRDRRRDGQRPHSRMRASERHESRRREDPQQVQAGQVELQRVDVGLGGDDARDRDAGDDAPSQQAPGGGVRTGLTLAADRSPDPRRTHPSHANPDGQEHHGRQQQEDRASRAAATATSRLAASANALVRSILISIRFGSSRTSNTSRDRRSLGIDRDRADHETAARRARRARPSPRTAAGPASRAGKDRRGAQRRHQHDERERFEFEQDAEDERTQDDPAPPARLQPPHDRVQRGEEQRQRRPPGGEMLHLHRRRQKIRRPEHVVPVEIRVRQIPGRQVREVAAHEQEHHRQRGHAGVSPATERARSWSTR